MPIAMTFSELSNEAQFQATQRDQRTPGRGEVSIRVKAVSLNTVDLKIKEAPGPLAPPAPYVLGSDVAGIVDAVGEDVSSFSIGDEVYACTGGVGDNDGTYAQQVIADARSVAMKPANLTFRQAAAVPLAGITAWEALVTFAKVQPGETVLVHGGTGGVGHLGLQLATAMGARVCTTVSSENKAELVRNLGANEAINYRELSVEDYVNKHTGGKGFAVVFDTVGGPNITPSLEALANNGRLATTVSMGSAPDLTSLHMKNAVMHTVFMLIPMLGGEGLERHGEILGNLAILIEDGAIIPLLDEARFTLDDIGKAHAHFASGKAIGKVVVDVD